MKYIICTLDRVIDNGDGVQNSEVGVLYRNRRSTYVLLKKPKREWNDD